MEGGEGREEKTWKGRCRWMEWEETRVRVQVASDDLQLSTYYKGEMRNLRVKGEERERKR